MAEIPLGEFDAGELVQGRDGVVAVALVEQLAARPAVFNIEVAGEHVYEVTELGILVHNSLADDFQCQRFLELLKGKATLNSQDRTELASMLKQLKNFGWGAYFSGVLKVSAPDGMVDPHAHRILFKLGREGKQRDLVIEGMEILLKYDINPIFGRENLIWAPNIAGQHTTEALQKVVDELRRADSRGTRKAVERALARMGKIAADL